MLTQCTSAACCASAPGPLHISRRPLRVHPVHDRLHQRHAVEQLQDCTSQASGPMTAGSKCRMVCQARSGKPTMRQLEQPSLGCRCIHHMGPPRQEGGGGGGCRPASQKHVHMGPQGHTHLVTRRRAAHPVEPAALPAAAPPSPPQESVTAPSGRLQHDGQALVAAPHAEAVTCRKSMQRGFAASGQQRRTSLTQCQGTQKPQLTRWDVP